MSTDLLITAANVLLLLAIWNLGIRKSVLDHHRDKLFLLRDEVREHFMQRHSLEHPLYKELRSAINSKIAMTETMTLSRYVIWSNEIIANPALREEIDRELSERFRCRDPELNEFVTKFRNKSSDICLSYLVYSSFWLLMLTLVIRIGYGLKLAFSKVASHDWKSIFTRELSDGVKKLQRETYGERFRLSTLEETTFIAVCN